MRKHLKLFASFIIAIFIIAVFLVILRRLPDLANFTQIAGFSLPEPLKQYQTEAIKEKLALERDKYAVERLKLAKETAAIRQQIEDASFQLQLQHIRNIAWTVTAPLAVLFVFACLPVIFWYKSQEVAAVVVALRHSNNPNITALELKNTQAQLKLYTAMIQAEQNSVHSLPPAIDIEGSEAVATIPTAAECLDLSYMTQVGGRFLWGFHKDASPCFMTLKKDGFKAAIIGMPEQGKTYKMVGLAAQAYYKGWQGINIDLHSNTDRSLYKYLSPFAERDSIYWCTDPDDVNDTLDMIRTEHERRLRGGTYTPLLIMIDDALSIGNSAEYADRFETSVVKVATEGSKVGISLIVAAHNWQADSMPKQFRSNFNWRCAYRCDASESHLLFQDKKSKYSGLTPDLTPGTCILLDNQKDMHTLQGPLWDRDTIQRMADTAKEATAIKEPFSVPAEAYRGRLHLVG